DGIAVRDPAPLRVVQSELHLGVRALELKLRDALDGRPAEEGAVAEELERPAARRARRLDRWRNERDRCPGRGERRLLAAAALGLAAEALLVDERRIRGEL